MAEDKTNWAQWLKLLEFAFNAHVTQITGTSPFQLLLGFIPWSAFDLKYELWDHDQARYSFTENGEAFIKGLQMHWESARRAIAKAQEAQRRQYDKSHKPVPNIQPGSLILVNPHSLEWTKAKGKGVKLTQHWIGPFEVQQKVNPKMYRLRMGDNYPGLPIFNIDHLKVYHPSPPKLGNQTSLPETR